MRQIEDVRKAKGFTQEYVANSVGVAVSSYNQYETGARSIPADVAERIASILNVEMGEIFLPVKFTVREQAAKYFTDSGQSRFYTKEGTP